MNGQTKMKRIEFVAKEQAVLVERDAGPVGPREIAGPALCTLVSPGTELAAAYCANEGFPRPSGYAAVFQVEQIGEEARAAGVRVGEVRFCMGNHASFQKTEFTQSVLVPEGLAAEKAVLTRLAGIGMTTLITTTARPGDVVAIGGLGPVGYLCAQIFLASGYRVMAADPDAERRSIAQHGGVRDVYASLTDLGATLAAGDKPALAVDCSGHEAAVLDALRIIRKKGEVVLLGVPWQKKTDLSAHAILWEVFHKYPVLRSGWEWELPRVGADFQPHSIFGNCATVLRWLEQGRIACDGLLQLNAPEDAQRVYQNLLNRRAGKLFQIFDWRADQ